MKELSILIAVILIAVLVVGVFCLVTEWTDNNLEWLIGYAKGVPQEQVQIGWGWSALATLFSGGICIPFNIMCEIAKVVVKVKK